MDRAAPDMEEPQPHPRIRELFRAAGQLEARGDLEGALAQVSRAVELEPESPVCWAAKGQVLFRMGRLDAAEHACRKAIELDDRAYYAWTELGFVFEEQELFEDAAFCFGKSAKLQPTASLFTLMANVELTFDVRAALRHAQRAITLDPDWQEAWMVRDAALEAMAEDDGTPEP